MTFDPATHFDDGYTGRKVAENPLKVCLLIDPTAVDPKPTTIADVLAITADTIIVGMRFPDDIFRTTFDRFTGMAIDNGRLQSQSIPASELARLERFWSAGAYTDLRDPKDGPVPPPVPAAPPSEPMFDPDAMMG